MIAQTSNLTSLLEQIARMETAEDIQGVNEAREQFYQDATTEEKQQIRDAFRKRNAELIELSKQQSEDSLKLLRKHGFVLDTAEWLTIKRYAEKYSVTTQLVSNWITRGVIPADCVEDLPELNNIRLVKDQPYR